MTADRHLGAQDTDYWQIIIIFGKLLFKDYDVL